MSFDVLCVRTLRRVRFDASRMPSAARPGSGAAAPKCLVSSPRLASGVVSPGAEALGCPSPSSRLPGFSVLTVPRAVASPGSSVLRLHLPYRVHRPQAARSRQPPRPPPLRKRSCCDRNARLNRAPLARFSGPFDASAASPVHTGLATPCHLPPMAFPRPTTGYSSLHLVALFHATGARGVPSPSRLSPPRGAAPPLDGRCPPDVSRVSSPARLRRNADLRARPPGPVFRALLPPRSPLLPPAV